MDVILAALERDGPATFGGLDDPLEAAVLAVLMELTEEAEDREALVF